MVSLTSGKAGAKVITALIKEVCKKNKYKKYQDSYYRTVLYRLKKDGLIENPMRGIWALTLKGRNVTRVIGTERVPKAPVAREEADTVIIFDIPELQRKKRATVRYELFMRGFFPFQKSVWLGKGPMDKDFIDFLKDMCLLQCVHIFSIAKRGTLWCL